MLACAYPLVASRICIDTKAICLVQVVHSMASVYIYSEWLDVIDEGIHTDRVAPLVIHLVKTALSICKQC